VRLSESQKTALRIMASYLIIGAFWLIVFRYLLPSHYRLTTLFDIEGWTFIILTSVFIYKSIQTPLEKNYQIARALRHNEEKYRSLVEEINEVIFVIDHFGKITYISPAVYDLTGYRPKEMLGHLFLEYIHPQDEEIVIKAFNERLKNTSAPLQYRVQKRDGSFAWVRSLSKLFKDAKGHTGIRGVLMDITDLVEKDRALVQSEARWRSLVEQAPDYIITTDLHGKIEFVNRNFFSIPEKMVIGHFIYDLVPQTEMRKVYNAIQMVNAQGNAHRFEIRLTIDEQKRCYFIRVGPIKKAGQIVGLTFIATDITRRKKSEQELQEYRAHLQNLVSERTQMLKNANQELDSYNRFFKRELKQLLNDFEQTFKEMHALGKAVSDKGLDKKLEALDVRMQTLLLRFENIRPKN